MVIWHPMCQNNNGRRSFGLQRSVSGKMDVVLNMQNHKMSVYILYSSGLLIMIFAVAFCLKADAASHASATTRVCARDDCFFGETLINESVWHVQEVYYRQFHNTLLIRDPRICMYCEEFPEINFDVLNAVLDSSDAVEQ